jgi:AdoMet-dependent heme synthase
MAPFPHLMTLANRVCRMTRLYASNRSLRAVAQLPRFAASRLLLRPFPANVSIALTYRCQCQCEHCYSNAPDRKDHEEMTTADLKAVIDQVRSLGALQVIFSAGEPLLRNDLEEVIRHAHRAGLLTRLNTNGLLLDRARASRLKEAGLTQCAVSIDHADAGVHDSLRGVPGAFDRAVQAIRHLGEAGIPCQICTYASRRLIPDGLRDIISLGRELGVTSVYFFWPVAAGRYDSAFDRMLSAEERAFVRTLQDSTFVHLELPTPRTRCDVIIKRILFVSPRGDVTPCPFVPYVLGNIKVRSLEEIWRRHCGMLKLDYRDDCLMNDVRQRDAIEMHVENVAGSLG